MCFPYTSCTCSHLERKKAITVKHSPIKHGPEILQLLQAVNLPKEVVVIHCKGHQKENSPVAKGSKRAHKEAKSAALKTLSSTSLALFPFQGGINRS